MNHSLKILSLGYSLRLIATAVVLVSLVALTGCQGVRYHTKRGCQGPDCLQAAMAAHTETCDAEPMLEAGQPEVLAPHSRFHPVPTKPVFEPNYNVAPAANFEEVPVQGASTGEPTMASHDDDPPPSPDEALGKSILVKSKAAKEASTANVAAAIGQPSSEIRTVSAIEPVAPSGWRPRGTRR